MLLWLLDERLLATARWTVRCWLFLIVSLSLGCRAAGAPPPARAAPAPVASQALFRGTAAEYVPAAGLRWMVVGNPRRLLEYPILNQELASVLPPERFEAFRDATAIDLRRVSDVLVAGFDYGRFYLVMIPGSTRDIESRFRDRLTSEPIERRSDPRVVRISGVVDATPQTLVSIDGLLAGFAVGDPTAARVAQAYATRRLRRSPTALAGAALGALPRAFDQAAIRFYAPGPFPGEWQRGLGGLLSTATALGVAVEPQRDGTTLLVSLTLSGDWPDTVKARELLRRAWEELASSGLGRLVGFDTPHRPPEFSATPQLLGLAVEVEVRPLIRGLNAAVAADVQMMMDLGPRAPAPRAAPRVPP